MQNVLDMNLLDRYFLLTYPPAIQSDSMREDETCRSITTNGGKHFHFFP